MSLPHSSPFSQLVNDAILHDLCSFRYTSFDEEVAMVHHCDLGATLGKCNIKSASRLLPVHPEDFEFLGFSFQGHFYMERTLPMGCSISCSTFEKFSTFLKWAVRMHAGLDNMAHYLDDFLFAGQAGMDQCSQLLAEFHGLAGELGVSLAHEKTEGPSPVLTFLGVEIDTPDQVSWLPLVKVQKLGNIVETALSKKQLTFFEFQQLLGYLNFACKVVASGCAFF